MDFFQLDELVDLKDSHPALIAAVGLVTICGAIKLADITIRAIVECSKEAN